ncbi:MAG: hypothetical protein IJQ11_01900 [Bacteroidales bacterium]|nr:hypothetical protein [Bacteroidales bacterium]
MITPTEIRKKAENKYLTYLRSVVERLAFEPVIIVGNKKPNDDTAQFEKELTELIAHSKEKKGYGYSIEYQKVKTRKHGKQDIPVSIGFKTERDYLKFIGKEQETVNFRRDVEKILSVFPELYEWIRRFPDKILYNHKVWGDLLKVCTYFKNNPNPQLYIRELPIRVDTKFIERNKGIIKELLDIVIAESVNTGESRFESRFNLRYDEPLARFRVLDKTLSQALFSGVDDLSVPISQFQKVEIPVEVVYIVENKMNMLTFPPIHKSIVVWGHGFGVDILKDVPWLKSKKIFYWGDLDAHGFQILSEIRMHFPQVKSFLMDRATFDLFYEDAVGTETNVEKELCLTQKEKAMFEYVKENKFRLEQEKIPFDYASSRIPIE